MRRSAALTLVLVLAGGATTTAAPAASEPPARHSLRWVPDAADSNKVAVEVSGLNKAEAGKLRTVDWTTAQWQRLLAIHAGQGDWTKDMGLPPMAGAYRADAGVLRFHPQFPLEPGVQYRATFRPDALPTAARLNSRAAPPLTAHFRRPPRRTMPSTVVARVYPSTDEVPENLLKFYVQFSAPMSRGHIYDHIHLREAGGRAIELPFLEIDEELWDPAMTRLTLFIDPGRIKREVRPLEEVGPSLEAGKSYTLAIDRAWQDSDGLPMAAAFEKQFRVGPPARRALDPAEWKLQPPAPGTRDPVTVTFPAPLDHALALRLISAVHAADGTIAGQAQLSDTERRWSFIPAQPWGRGPHHLRVPTTIEDLAGNNIGKSFEVDLFEGVQRRLTNATVKIPFDIR